MCDDHKTESLLLLVLVSPSLRLGIGQVQSVEQNQTFAESMHNFPVCMLRATR